jgi:uncharacterized protein (TIGR02001 family)
MEIVAGVVASIGRVALLAGLLASRAVCADDWGGSVAATSDYVVRGFTRSDDEPAAQVDLHYLGGGGLLAGVFASTAHIDPEAGRDVELNGFVGFARRAGEDWGAKLLASVYAYPGGSGGSAYDYGEFDLDLAYRDWIDVKLLYSPDTPRYVLGRGLVRVGTDSAEIALQHPIRGRLHAMLGAGYSVFAGDGRAGYAYWSSGVLYDLAPVALLGTYVGTSPEARALYYGTITRNHWLATVIWRF